MRMKRFVGILVSIMLVLSLLYLQKSEAVAAGTNEDYKHTVNNIDGGTVSTQISSGKKCKIMVFGDADNLASEYTVRSLYDLSLGSDYEPVFIDTSCSASATSQLRGYIDDYVKKKVPNSTSKVMFCYGNGETSKIRDKYMSGAFFLIYPLTVFVDSNNNFVSYSMGPQSASSLAGKISAITGQQVGGFAPTPTPAMPTIEPSEPTVKVDPVVSTIELNVLSDPMSSEYDEKWYKIYIPRTMEYRYGVSDTNAWAQLYKYNEKTGSITDSGKYVEYKIETDPENMYSIGYLDETCYYVRLYRGEAKGDVYLYFGEDYIGSEVAPIIEHDNHTCKGEAVAEVPATCTKSGTKAYYKCECGKFYEDEACTKEIEDLDAWIADKDGGKIAAKGHTAVVDKAVAATSEKSGLTEGSHCSVCNEVLTAQVPTTYINVGNVYTTSTSTVTYAAPANTIANTIEVPATVKINGKTYKVTAIGAGAFKGCKNLTTVKIGANVKTIGDAAFKGCKNLKTVKIGSNVTAIGENAFAGCTKLKTVKLNSKLKTISKNAFSKCTSLAEIVIPDKVTVIADSAFNGCTKLKAVTIGKSVKTIGAKAFNGCKNLTSIKILSTKITKISTDAFKKISSKAKIKVPSKKITSYTKLIKASGVPSKVTLQGRS